MQEKPYNVSEIESPQKKVGISLACRELGIWSPPLEQTIFPADSDAS